MSTNPNLETHLVHDYEFFMNNGTRQLFTVDEFLGDSINFAEATYIKIVIAEKPSRTNPDFKHPGEDFTIYTSQVSIIAHRTRQAANNPALKVPAFAKLDPPQTIPESR